MAKMKDDTPGRCCRRSAGRYWCGSLNQHSGHYVGPWWCPGILN